MREILVEIIVDLHHRRIGAGTKAFDLKPRELAVGRDVALVADLVFQDLFQVLRAHAMTRHRAAKLDEMRPDRLKVEHGVEGRDLHHPDVRHAEHFGDMLDRGRGSQPPACFWACQSNGMTAEACRPAGYFATCVSTKAWLALSKVKLAGWTASGAGRRDDI